MFVNIENKRIYYEFAEQDLLNSSDEIIIFLHEGLGSVAQWFDFPEKLCKTMNLPGLMYDRYGFGKSDALKEDRPNDYLWQEAVFLEKLKNHLLPNKKIIIFGHSDGATLALLYASMFNENLSFVVSIAHHIIIEKQTVEGMKTAINAYENGKLRQALEKFHPNKVDSMFYGWAKFWPLAKHFDISEQIRKIKCPVLAIQGENDQYGTPYQLTLVDQNIPKSETHLISACDHYPHRKCGDTVIDLFKNFYNKTHS